MRLCNNSANVALFNVETKSYDSALQEYERKQKFKVYKNKKVQGVVVKTANSDFYRSPEEIKTPKNEIRDVA